MKHDVAVLVDRIADAEAISHRDVGRFPDLLKKHGLKQDDLTPGVIKRAESIHLAEMKRLRDDHERKEGEVQVKLFRTGWWIIGHSPRMGPYVTKSEAVEALRGVKRFYKDNPDLEDDDMATAEAVQFDKTAVIDLYVAFGMKGASRWPVKRLVDKLEKIVEGYDEDAVDLNDDQVTLLNEITEALGDDLEIDIVEGDSDSDGEEDETPQARRSKKTSKKKTAKKTTKKASAKKAAPTKKASGKKTTKKKAPAKKSGGPSNKEVVYKAWNKSKKKSPEDLHDLVGDAVKLATVRSWVSQWARGKNLPACAAE